MFVPLALLVTATVGCGGAGGDDATEDEAPHAHDCFTVTPDAAAAAIGALPRKQEQCNRGTEYDLETAADGTSRAVTDVFVGGSGGKRPPPGWATIVELHLTYVDKDVAPAVFHAADPCGFGQPSSVKVTLDYQAYDPNEGKYAEWSCPTCLNDSATFDLSITSVEGRAPKSLDYPPYITSNTIHGTLHAVCAPKTTPSTGATQAAGNVTIDGPF